ncbi:hypothetical protein CSKR_100094, partial [Clonorchis sinensis]
VAFGMSLCIQDLATLQTQWAHIQFMVNITNEMLDRAGQVLRVLHSASETLPQSGSYCENRRNERIREIEQEQLWEEMNTMVSDFNRLLHGFQMAKYINSLVTNLRQRLGVVRDGLNYTETPTVERLEPQEKRENITPRRRRRRRKFTRAR